MEVAGAVGGLVDAQGPLEELHGEGVLAQLPAGAAQVGEGDGHPGVVGAVGGLVDAQGPLKELHGCGVLAQLPAGVAQVGEVSRSLKILARELELPVIAVSQLSRNLEHRQDKRPVLPDLRDSGALEQDADPVIFIYRDDVYNADSPQKGIAEIHIAKHRSGAIGKIDLAWLDHYTRFADLRKG
jgi:hypothetical protein